MRYALAEQPDRAELSTVDRPVHSVVPEQLEFLDADRRQQRQRVKIIRIAAYRLFKETRGGFELIKCEVCKADIIKSVLFIESVYPLMTFNKLCYDRAVIIKNF